MTTAETLREYDLYDAAIAAGFNKGIGHIPSYATVPDAALDAVGVFFDHCGDRMPWLRAIYQAERDRRRQANG